jgi:hypothetical protein
MHKLDMVQYVFVCVWRMNDIFFYFNGPFLSDYSQYDAVTCWHNLSNIMNYQLPESGKHKSSRLEINTNYGSKPSKMWLHSIYF